MSKNWQSLQSLSRRIALTVTLLGLFVFGCDIISKDSAQLYHFSQIQTNDKPSKEKKLVSSQDLIAVQEPAKMPLAPPDTNAPPSPTTEAQPPVEAGPVINFNNISIVEFIRFVSRLSGRNFIFDPQELQFTVTVISQSPASVSDIMAALLQNLRIHDFELMEQGSSLLIYKNKEARAPAKLISEPNPDGSIPQIATQVFLIEYVDPARVAAIVKNMVSKDAIVELIAESKRLVVTDISANIYKISEILVALDSPNSGLEIGQYVAQNATPGALAAITQQLLEPVLTGQPFILVPHTTSNSVFVVSSPFLAEKALSIMQKIDLGDNVSRLFSFDTLKFDKELAERQQEKAKRETAIKTVQGFTEEELARLTPEQLHMLLREKGLSDDEIKQLTEEERKRHLQELDLGPLGQSTREELRKARVFESNLPIGQLESTKFYIHKLQYRRAGDVTKALKAIATSIQSSNAKSEAQSDLITTLNTIQMIEESNAIVLTGTTGTLKKAKELIAEIDLPVRQVMIEVLVLDTTIINSLNFGVQWGAKGQRQNWTVEGGLFNPGNAQIPASLAQVTQVPGRPTTPPPPHGSFPSSVYDLGPPAFNTLIPITNTSTPGGFTLGSIGRKILFNGHGFMAMNALINALRTDSQVNIIMNPKITTEHNVPAEIYVGQKIGVKGQSVNNFDATLVTTNYEIKDVGVLLKVTPLISAKDDTVTLIIEQRISSANPAEVLAQGNLNAPPVTINETRTITRVHLESDQFIVLSGMIQETKTVTKRQVPCLGSLPLIGSAFSDNSDGNNKRNLILFMRPHIMETPRDIDETSKTQEDNFREKSKPIREQRRIVDDLRDILTIPPE